MPTRSGHLTSWRKLLLSAGTGIMLAASVCCAASPHSFSPSEAGGGQYFGRKIGRIDLRGVSALNPQRALQLIKLHQGNPLTRDGLREPQKQLGPRRVALGERVPEHDRECDRRQREAHRAQL